MAYFPGPDKAMVTIAAIPIKWKNELDELIPSVGMITSNKAINKIPAMGHAVYLTLYPTKIKAPNINSDNIKTQPTKVAAENPNPPSIPIIPSGAIILR